MKRHLSLLIFMLFIILSQGIAYSSPIDVRQGELEILKGRIIKIESP